MHALVRFAHIAAGDTFTMRDLHSAAAAALETIPISIDSRRCATTSPRSGPRASLEKVPHSRRYRLVPQGYTICVVFLKLSERVYAPLTAGLLRPVAADARLPEDTRHQTA